MIGASALRDHEVVFDRELHRVGFFPTDCQAVLIRSRNPHDLMSIAQILPDPTPDTM